jgi:uridine kinase
MPAGLDGNPDPLRSPARDAVLAAVADPVAALPGDRRVVVAIDGIDGAGKSTFADELVSTLERRPGFHRELVRSTVDSFHHPRAVRHARGPGSATGSFRDSTNLEVLRADLLDPFRAGTDFRVAAFDEPSDAPVDDPPRPAAPDAVLVFDGIFLHRPELRASWDLSVFLDGWDRVERGRIERATSGCPDDPVDRFVHLTRWWVLMRRYVQGQRLYLAECDPAAIADLVVDNVDLARPRLVRG